MTTDPKLVEAGAQAIELCSLWTPRRLADAVLTAAIPLIRKAALEEAAKELQKAARATNDEDGRVWLYRAEDEGPLSSMNDDLSIER